MSLTFFSYVCFARYTKYHWPIMFGEHRFVPEIKGRIELTLDLLLQWPWRINYSSFSNLPPTQLIMDGSFQRSPRWPFHGKILWMLILCCLLHWVTLWTPSLPKQLIFYLHRSHFVGPSNFQGIIVIKSVIKPLLLHHSPNLVMFSEQQSTGWPLACPWTWSLHLSSVLRKQKKVRTWSGKNNSQINKTPYK
jgi:hypothetical protein